MVVTVVVPVVVMGVLSVLLLLLVTRSSEVDAAVDVGVMVHAVGAVLPGGGKSVTLPFVV